MEAAMVEVSSSSLNSNTRRNEELTKKKPVAGSTTPSSSAPQQPLHNSNSEAEQQRSSSSSNLLTYDQYMKIAEMLSQHGLKPPALQFQASNEASSSSSAAHTINEESNTSKSKLPLKSPAKIMDTPSSSLTSTLRKIDDAPPSFQATVPTSPLSHVNELSYLRSM